MNIQRILSITASAIFFCAQLETANAQSAPPAGDNNAPPIEANGNNPNPNPNGAQEGGILPFDNPYNSVPFGPTKGGYGIPGTIPGGQIPFPQQPFIPHIQSPISQFPNQGMFPGAQMPIPQIPRIPSPISQFPNQGMFPGAQMPIPQIPRIPSPISQFPNPGFGPGYGMGCTPVSVRGDATYCVQGPVCSGSGYAPVGMSCPVAGEMAIADCKPGLPSSAGGMSCRLPMNARCVQVNFNTWGCALENDWGMPNGGWNRGPGQFPSTPFPSPPIQSQWGGQQQQFGVPQGGPPFPQRQWSAPPLAAVPRQWGK